MAKRRTKTKSDSSRKTSSGGRPKKAKASGGTKRKVTRKKATGKKTSTTRKKAAPKKAARKKAAKKKTVKKSAKKKSATKKPVEKKATKKKAAKKKPAKKKAATKKTTRRGATKKKAAKKKSASKSGKKSKSSEAKGRRGGKRKKSTATEPTKTKRRSRRKSKPKYVLAVDLNAAPPAGAASPPSPGPPPPSPSPGPAPASPQPLAVERIISPAEFRAEIRSRRKELQAEKARADKVLAQIADRIRGKKHGEVTGYTVGLRMKSGRLVSPLKYVIQIHVACKLPDRELKKRGLHKFVNEIDGIPIKVIETAPITADGQVCPIPPSDTVDGEERFIVGGLPISELDNRCNWGTFGIRMPVAADTAPTVFVGIANAHFAKKGEAMVQPPGGPSFPEIIFGSVKQWSFDTNDPDTNIDASNIELGPTRISKDGVLGVEERPFLFPDDTRVANGDPVWKYGARTERLIKGYVLNSTFNSLTIDGREYNGIVEAVSNTGNQFIKKGDSGCVGLTPIIDTRTDSQAYLVSGLFFAMKEDNTGIGFACHMADVVERLELKVHQDFLIGDDWELDESEELDD